MVAGLAVAGYTLGGPVANIFGGGGDAAKLELGQTIVINRTSVYRSAGTGLEQSPQTAPQIDMTLRNSGSSPTWIAQARITIVDSAPLPDCIYGPAGGGQIPTSKPYRILASRHAARR